MRTIAHHEEHEDPEEIPPAETQRRQEYCLYCHFDRREKSFGSLCAFAPLREFFLILCSLLFALSAHVHAQEKKNVKVVFTSLAWNSAQIRRINCDMRSPKTIE